MVAVFETKEIHEVRSVIFLALKSDSINYRNQWLECTPLGRTGRRFITTDEICIDTTELFDPRLRLLSLIKLN